MDFSIFDGRDVIILALVLAAVYFLISLLRLGQIKLRQRQADRLRKQAAESDVGLSKNKREEGAEEISPPELEPVSASHPPTLPHMSFDEQLFRSNVENELEQLHSEVAALKEALAQLKNASRPVSPQYNEAMLLAQRGMKVQSIADHCAISIGEAELVVALSRNKQEYENYDSPDDRRY